MRSTQYLLALLLPILSSAAELEIEHLTSLPTPCTRKSQQGDTISVHYRGMLSSPTGTEFDASYNRGSPLVFKLGSGQVIKGWDQGLEGMCIGEKWRLTIPPELGYGSRAMGPIPAGSTLVFDSELVGIQGVVAEDAGASEEDAGAGEKDKEAGGRDEL